MDPNGRLNATLIDPSRWGWTAASGVADLLTPQERSRRTASQGQTRSKRKRPQPVTAVASASVPPSPKRKASSLSDGSTGEPSSSTSAEPAAVADAAAAAITSTSTADKPQSAADLDWFAYRGSCRDDDGTPTEGEEDREEMATDTHHYYGVGEPPWATARCTVRFPLNSATFRRNNGSASERTTAASSSSSSETTQPSETEERRSFFREAIVWNWLPDRQHLPVVDGEVYHNPQRFLSPENFDLIERTPMEFAAAIAQEYGLSFAETMDVAELMQTQLRSWVTAEANATPPTLLWDAHTGQRRPPPRPVAVPELYGNVTSLTAQGGRVEKTTSRPLYPNQPAPMIRRHSSVGSASAKRPSAPRRPSVSLSKRVAKKPSAASTATTGGKRRKNPSAASTAATGGKRRRSAKETFVQDVRQRLVQASKAQLHSSTSPPSLKVQNCTGGTGICHVCTNSVGIFAQFPCNHAGHSYCRIHLKLKLALILPDDVVNTGTVPSPLQYCPVCALTCTCDSCTATLDALVRDLPATPPTADPPTTLAAAITSGDTITPSPTTTALSRLEQDETKDSAPEPTVDMDILARARSLRRVVGDKRSTSANRSKQNRHDVPARQHSTVPKIPPEDLPREVSDGRDIDPGTDADYAATYTTQGPVYPSDLNFSIAPTATTSSLSNQRDVVASPAPSVVIEDGSVDFCNICRLHGSLLCCDFCPRAFHAACIQPSLQNDDVGESDDTPWKCPACIAEADGFPEDLVDPSKSLEPIRAAYSTIFDPEDSNDNDMLVLLGSINEMIKRLIEYDFGHVFSEPVDVDQVPDYLSTVKRPMDLGTVSKKLLDGSYHVVGSCESLQNVALQALRDVDQVWENCYAYNVDGSAVYRMALVLERRAKAIRKASFDNLLTDNMIKALGYDKPENDVHVAKPVVPLAITVATSYRPKKSQHKITVSKNASSGRLVAVLDPSSQQIVKIYSTMRAASAAVIYLVGLGHRCEWNNIEADTIPKMRKILKDAHLKPANTVFGYRWILLDNLKAGGIVFPKKPPPSFVTDSQSQSESASGQVIKRNCDGAIDAEFASMQEAYSDYSSSFTEDQGKTISKSQFFSHCRNGTVLLGNVSYAFKHTNEPSESRRSDCGDPADPKELPLKAKPNVEETAPPSSDGSCIGSGRFSSILHESGAPMEMVSQDLDTAKLRDLGGSPGVAGTMERMMNEQNGLSKNAGLYQSYMDQELCPSKNPPI